MSKSTPIHIVNADELYQPICAACDARGEYTLATRERWGEPICESCDDRANERAYESMLSDFYGGSGPVTMHEFCSRAAADKARGR